MHWMKLMNIVLNILQMYCGMISKLWYQHFQQYLLFLWHSLKFTIHLRFQLNLEILYPCFFHLNECFTLFFYDKFQLSHQWLWKPSQELNLKNKKQKKSHSNCSFDEKLPLLYSKRYSPFLTTLNPTHFITSYILIFPYYLTNSSKYLSLSIFLSKPYLSKVALSVSFICYNFFC